AESISVDKEWRRKRAVIHTLTQT
ncbi:hypothetical protein MGSAQ_003285, partial [marine sediment metagenome]